jgi:hydroxymethylbilane synthase
VIANRLRIATRASALAMAQTKIVADLLKAVHPELGLQVLTVSTHGDRDRISPLWQMSGSGFFTSQLEQALIEDTADIAVHSYKDLPVQMAPGLMVAAVPERQHAQDVLVASALVKSLGDLKQNALIGSSSPRRIAQLRHVRPDLQIQPIRGNVETRLSRVKEGDFDAIVLARAGLERLNLMPKASFVFNPADFIPAPAQGAIAVQCRQGDAEIVSLLADIHHNTTGMAVAAERMILAGLHPGCHVPVGVFAQCSKEDMSIDAIVSDLEGRRVIKERVKGPAASYERSAQALLQTLLDAGAGEIIRGFESA